MSRPYGDDPSRKVSLRGVPPLTSRQPFRANRGSRVVASLQPAPVGPCIGLDVSPPLIAAGLVGCMCNPMNKDKAMAQADTDLTFAKAC